LEKAASFNGLYEAFGDFSRPKGAVVHGLGFARGRGGVVIEAYCQARASAAQQLRKVVAGAFGAGLEAVTLVGCGGIVPQGLLNAGEASAHRDLAARNISGTLGGFAGDLTSELVLAVSNNHVFAKCNRAKPNDPLVLTASQSQFGGLARFHPLQPQPTVNDLDGAVGWVFAGNVIRQPRLHGTRPPALGLRVSKNGARTGRTTGTIVGIAATAVIAYPGLGNVNFRRCIRIEGDSGPFSLPGDSGSLVLDGKNSVVGIVFAGETDGSFSFANSATALTTHLGIGF
jgi:hypothetical protein